MRIHWTDTAYEHLDAIHAYISKDSSAYARHTVNRLTRRSQQIAEAPFSGRRVPEYDMNPVRKIIVGSYRIIYHVQPSQVDILAVIHGVRQI